jgi:hypothetical protein
MSERLVSLLIPWRGDDPWRLRLKDWVLSRWRALLPQAEICEGSGPADGPFNRSAAINEAFRKSNGTLLIVADADTAASRMGVRDAIEIADLGRPMLPYTVYFNLKEPETAALLTKPPEVAINDPQCWEHRLEDSVSGVVVLPRAAFDAVGGFDEQFMAWGHEDRAFALALETLAKPVGRIAEPIVHLWHPAPENTRFGNPYMKANGARYALYQKARGDTVAMRRLVSR